MKATKTKTKTKRGGDLVRTRRTSFGNVSIYSDGVAGAYNVEIRYFDLGLTIALSSKCPKTGAREISFFRSGNQGRNLADTSCPVGRCPVRTLRAVDRFVRSSTCKLWCIAGDDRLAKFYARALGGQSLSGVFRINY